MVKTLKTIFPKKKQKYHLFQKQQAQKKGKTSQPYNPAMKGEQAMQSKAKPAPGELVTGSDNQ